MANKRRYGGFIIHAGTVLVFIGIIASSFFSVDKVFTVQENESFELRGYDLKFAGLSELRDPEKNVVFATIEVSENGKSLGQMFPQKHFHHKNDQPATEVAIRSRLYEDLYIVLSGWDENGSVSFHVFVNPMVQLIWIGIGIMSLGGVFVIFPDRKPTAARATRRAPEEAQDEAA